MKLAHVIKTYFVVDYNDLEQFIINEFGHDDYSFVADIECGNASDHEINVVNEPLDEYHQARVDRFIITGNGSYVTKHLLQHLCTQGKVLPGRYLISVSW